MKINIYHNIGPDGFMRASARGPLAWVFTYELPYTPDGPPHERVLADAFREFNVAAGTELAEAYRARRLRSLSVGDVVQIDGTAYACEPAGWSLVAPADLKVLPAARAEIVVRELYGMGPDEELSVTVPLPD